MLAFVLALLPLLAAGARPPFEASQYHWLDVFGSMVRGSHLPAPESRYGGTK